MCAAQRTVRRTGAAFVLAGVLSVLAGCATDSDSDTLIVFAASSLVDAFAEIGAAFEQQNAGADVVITTGGSSALRAQIIDGAPAAVFASANASTMDAVVEAGDTAAGPQVFARNGLEVVAPAGNAGGVRGLSDLARGDLFVGLCAVGVPCGDLSRDVLGEGGVIPSVDTDEPDARALLSKIVDGELDVGLVYTTDALSAGDHVVAFATGVDLNTPYLIAPLEGAADPELASAFVDYVTGRTGQAVLSEQGFLAP
ncbi:MAG: molybdate ABC transporter substrate-binding protein [Actinomycetota bacterium]